MKTEALFDIAGVSNENYEWHRIREILDYNAATGVFRWRVDMSSNIKAGMTTGSRTKKGYLLIRAERRTYLAHRLAWFWMTGRWPKEQIDHRNRKKDDNRWDNLREATNSENHLNRGPNSNNTSGFKGVSLNSKIGKYEAYLTVHGQRRFLGYHDTPELAHAAYASEISRVSPAFGRITP